MFIFLSVIFMYCIVINNQSRQFYSIMNLILLIMKVLMIIVGWITIVASISILFRKGTNRTLRNLALRRQLIFLFLFTFWHTMFSIFFYDSNLLKKANLSQGAIRFISIYL